MKTLSVLVRMAVMAAVVALMTACSGKSDYRSALPENTMLAVAFQPAQLVAKSGVNAETMAQSPLYQRFVEQMDASGILSDEEKEQVLSLLTHPEESGIDGSRPSYFFVAPVTADATEFVGGLLAPVGDAAKFSALIDRINARSGSLVVKEDELSVVRIGENSGLSGLCAYNAEAVMCCFGQGSYESLSAYVKERFAARNSESLLADATVAEFFSAKNDIDMLLSFKDLMQLYSQLPTGTLPMTDALAGVRMAGSMNFEKGRIAVTGRMLYASKEAEEQMKAFYTYVRDQKGVLLKYLPATSIATIGFGMVGSELYTTLSQMPGYGMMLANPMVKQVFDALEGDLVINFSGMLPDGVYPQATLLCEVNDPAVVDNLLAALPGLPVVKSGSGYSMSTGGVTLFFGVKEKVLYLTSDAVVKAALDGDKIESLTAQESLFRGNVSSMYLDCVRLNTLLVGYAAPFSQLQPAVEMLSLFTDVQAWGTKDRSEMIVRMQDETRNALESICMEVGRIMEQSLPAEVGNE